LENFITQFKEKYFALLDHLALVRLLLGKA